MNHSQIAVLVAAWLSAAACAANPRPGAQRATPATTVTTTVPSATAGPRAAATPPPPAKAETPEAEVDFRKPPQTETNSFGDRVPVHFGADGMLEAAFEAAKHTDTEARILAWMIEVDDRPLVVERVLLWFRIASKQGAPSYRLVNLFRHPLIPGARGKEWHVWTRSHVPPGVRSFPAPPTPGDLDDFAGFTDFDYDASDGFTLVDGQVCAGAWNKSFGSAPGRNFPTR